MPKKLAAEFTGFLTDVVMALMFLLTIPGAAERRVLPDAKPA